MNRRERERVKDINKTYIPVALILSISLFPGVKLMQCKQGIPTVTHMHRRKQPCTHGFHEPRLHGSYL